MVVGQKFDKRRGGLSVKGRWVSFVRLILGHDGSVENSVSAFWTDIPINEVTVKTVYTDRKCEN